MKTIYLPLLGLLLLFSCTSPQKLIEQGKIEKAFQVSLRNLERGKIKTEYVDALEKSYALLTAKDRAIYERGKNKQEISLWPKLYEKCLAMLDRQKKARKVEARLQQLGYYPTLHHLPVREWLAEARRNASIYYYGMAQELIPVARRGDRLAARKAYDYLERCDLYETNFRDVAQLEPEMYALGTTHILLNPELNPRREKLHNFFYDVLLANTEFPFRDNWQVFHETPIDNQEMHYALDLYFPNFYVSWDDCSSSCCSNSEDVVVAYRDVEVWSEKDSTYVTEQEPIYETISVTVTTYVQHKDAFIDLQSTYRNLKLGTEVHLTKNRGYSSWENVYSTYSGNPDALTASCNVGGSFEFHPSRRFMLDWAAHDLRARFYKSIKWDVDYNYYLREEIYTSGR